MKILVTGAGGMLGRDVDAPRAARAATRSSALGPRRARHHRPGARSSGRCRRATARRGRQLRRLDRRRRRRGRPRRGAMRVNDDGAGTRRGRRGGVGAKVVYPSTDYVFDGTQGRALRRVRPAGAALGLRPLQAGRRDLGRGRQPAPLHRPLLVAVRRRRARTSSRRCCGSATSSRRCSSSPTRSAARPTRGHLAEALALLIEGDEYGIHHIAGGGQCSWYEFAQEIFDQAGVECRVMAGDHRDARPPGAAARRTRCSAASATDPIVLPDWQRGPGRVPRRARAARRAA